MIEMDCENGEPMKCKPQKGEPALTEKYPLLQNAGTETWKACQQRVVNGFGSEHGNLEDDWQIFETD